MEKETHPKWAYALLTIATLCVLGDLTAHDFPYNPPKEMMLMEGYAILNHPVSTSNREAQAYFNQGFACLYAFNHDAAYWSFQKASRIDPQLAMAYWGMAIALGANINTPITPEREKAAYEQIQKAIKLSSSGITDNEKAYIQALSARYSNDDNFIEEKLALAYTNAMKEVVDKYPDDLDAATLYAESILNLSPWNQWNDAGEPIGDTMKAVGTLESILKRDPLHLGANHFYIHAVEGSKHPEWALMSAYRLTWLLPASGHLLHMPAHIFMRVGDYHQVVLTNEAAVAADQAYVDQFGITGNYPLHYLSHNLFFLSRAYCMEGRYQDALKTGIRLKEFGMPFVKEMPFLMNYVADPLFVHMRFNKWNEVINYPEYPQEYPALNGLVHFARAYAYVSLGKIEEAEKEHEKFLEIKKMNLTDLLGATSASTLFDIANLQFNAKLAFVQGQVPKAIDDLQKAVELQDGLAYSEPPDWYYSLRESLGAVLLFNRQYKEAESVFRRDLQEHPRNGRSLFGLTESLIFQNRRTEVFWVEGEFAKAWKYSSTPLTIPSLF